MALFTWALATGESYWMASMSAVPWILIGAVHRSPLPSITAPISRRGLAIRSIGRLEREASPVSLVSNGWAARIPESRRIVVPLFPQYTGSEGASNLPPIPCTRSLAAPPQSFSSSTSISTPIARMASTVHQQSSLGRKPSISQVPFAREANMTDRCEMLLSPGTTSSAVNGAMRLTLKTGPSGPEGAVLIWAFRSRS